MKKDDMVKELVGRIRYNMDQRDHYQAKENKSKNPAMWSELRAWYEGRVSAFTICLMAVDPDHPMVH